MSETTPDRADEATDDELRRHSQDPAEGPDPDADAAESEAVPRVHPEDPAEG